MLVCTGALGVKSRPGWLLILFVKGVLCKRFSLVGTIRPSFRQCLPLPGRLGRCLPYRGVQSFPPRRWRVCCCARRRTLVPAERSGCACVPRIWKQPTHLTHLGQYSYRNSILWFRVVVWVLSSLITANLPNDVIIISTPSVVLYFFFNIKQILFIL